MLSLLETKLFRKNVFLDVDEIFFYFFSVPVFVVVTKIDMSPPNVLQETLKLLVKILKSPGCRKVRTVPCFNEMTKWTSYENCHKSELTLSLKIILYKPNQVLLRVDETRESSHFLSTELRLLNSFLKFETHQKPQDPDSKSSFRSISRIQSCLIFY